MTVDLPDSVSKALYSGRVAATAPELELFRRVAQARAQRLISYREHDALLGIEEATPGHLYHVEWVSAYCSRRFKILSLQDVDLSHAMAAADLADTVLDIVLLRALGLKRERYAGFELAPEKPKDSSDAEMELRWQPMVEAMLASGFEDGLNYAGDPHGALMRTCGVYILGLARLVTEPKRVLALAARYGVAPTVPKWRAMVEGVDLLRDFIVGPLMRRFLDIFRVLAGQLPSQTGNDYKLDQDDWTALRREIEVMGDSQGVIDAELRRLQGEPSFYAFVLVRLLLAGLDSALAMSDAPPSK